MRILITKYSNPLPPKLWERYLHMLPVSWHNKALKFIRWQDQHAFVLGKILIHRGMNDLGYSSFNFREIKLNDYGKPFTDSKIHFNLSHSGEYVVCAFSEKGPVGIDIEERKPINWIEFSKIFTKNEIQILNKTKNSNNDFYRIWTRKESVIKGEGKGLSIPLHYIDTTALNQVSYNGKVWNIIELDIFPGYCCVFASENKLKILPELFYFNPIEILRD